MDELNDPDGTLRAVYEGELERGNVCRVVKVTSRESRKTCNMRVVEGRDVKWWGKGVPGGERKERNKGGGGNRGEKDKEKERDKRLAKEIELTQYPHATLEGLGFASTVITPPSGIATLSPPHGAVVGLDCEWRPATVKGVENKVAVMQIAWEGKVSNERTKKEG